MILVVLIGILVLAGAVAWLVARRNEHAARWLCLGACAAQLAITMVLWIATGASAAGEGSWFRTVSLPWVPALGIRFQLQMDGLSLLLVALNGLLGMGAVAAAWKTVRHRVGAFHLNLMWTLAAVAGVFLATDLFLFYFFWEMMLIPLYFLIRIWGGHRRRYAALKFFIFTQAGGLFLLVGILSLYFVHGTDTGVYTFDYNRLAGTSMPVAAEFWMMLAFFVAFAVKLPTVPVHGWLPDAHTQAPPDGSVDVAGLVLKVGAYGLLRFIVPLFPNGASAFAPAAMVLGVVSIYYGAVLALSQTDLKRLVAYTSISHMGFVLLGIFAWNDLALQGVVIVMLAHGLSTAGLFVLAGMVHRRFGTHDLGQLGGLWSVTPRMGGFMMFLAMATLGLPGLANFVGEWLVLVGTYQASPTFAALGAGGIIVSVIYSLWLVQRLLHGKRETSKARDLAAAEWGMLLPVAGILLWMGLAPQAFLDASQPAVRVMQMNAEKGTSSAGAVRAEELPPRPDATQAQGSVESTEEMP